jgi:pimeloyl-ACP methyl ester carboxylesterase
MGAVGVQLPPLPMPGVGRIDPPRYEGTVVVDGQRRLGFAEFGVEHGPLVLWFHGTPGARRQVAPVGREAATALGIRLVCVERPGVGASTPHRHRRIVDFAGDAAAVADHLGHQRFAVVGLSGGGPYALACAAAMPDRVAAVGVLGGVAPSTGTDRSATGVVNLARSLRRTLEIGRKPIGVAMQGAMAIVPAGHAAYLAYTRVAPPGDRAVLREPGFEAMFLDDLVTALRSGFGAIADDAALFGRHWGFRLDEVVAPVRWWHGDADNIVPLPDAVAAAERLPDVELHVRPGESHLGGFAVSDEVLEAMATYLRRLP